MDLLEKFSSVEVRADSRITETDRQFCQGRQDAYHAAIEAFQQLLAFWRDVTDQQMHILADPENPGEEWKRYLVSPRFPELTEENITLHIIKIHHRFISDVTGYLNKTYHLSVEPDSVELGLLRKNTSYDDTTVDRTAVLMSVLFRYEDVINEILSKFDGRSLSEQAPYELVENCHRAAWKEKDHSENYEQKKNLVKIISNACSYGYHNGYEQWHVYENGRHILRGLAHFETGGFEQYPAGIDSLLSDTRRLWYDLWEFDDCVKLERIKLFKNGRMDIRFTNEGYARQFVTDYLGTVW